MSRLVLWFTVLFTPAVALAEVYVLEPARVFDGETPHAGWVVVVRDARIEAAGPAARSRCPGTRARSISEE